MNVLVDEVLLTRRAQLICDSPEALHNENKYLQHVFRKNNYNSGFIKDHETNKTSNPTTTTAMILYVRGTSEIISCILRPYNIRVACRLITTLQNPRDRQGAIYKIKCADWQELEH